MENIEMVEQFFNERIEVKMGTVITKGELYNAYRDWCATKQFWSLTAAMFSRCVRSQFKNQTPANTMYTVNGKQKRIWRNLALK